MSKTPDWPWSTSQHSSQTHPHTNTCACTHTDSDKKHYVNKIHQLFLVETRIPVPTTVVKVGEEQRMTPRCSTGPKLNQGSIRAEQFAGVLAFIRLQILFEVWDNNAQYRIVWCWNGPIDARRATPRKQPLNLYALLEISCNIFNNLG